MNENNEFNAAMDELFALGRFGIKLGLETISQMLAGINDPHKKINCIHIAGTNGKGSVAQNIAYILMAAGYKVGVYTSPHLVHVNERFAINGQPISDEQVLEAYEAVKGVKGLDRQATFFEYTTAMALYAFDKAGVDWAVMETGMGGRLDATNVLSPKLCVITNVSIEHEMYLGSTLAEIAFEKGGIIKPETPVVTGVSQKNAVKVMKDISAERSAPLYRMGSAFSSRKQKDGGFSYYGMDLAWKGLSLKLAGEHQIPNATLALAACEVLIGQGAEISEDHIRQGLLNVKWPGRLEEVAHEPRIILDGAHNLAAMKVLVKHLKETYGKNKLIIVTGFLDDKPYAKMLPMLEELADWLIITKPEINRALDPQVLVDLLPPGPKHVTVVPIVGDAVKRAMDDAKPENIIVIAGSLYVVGEARQALTEMGLV